MERIVIATFFAVALAACDVAGLRGNGHVVSEQRDLAPFRNLDIRGAFDVDWRSGSPSVSVTTDENLMQFVQLSVSEGTLHASTTRSVHPTHSIKLKLAGRTLEAANFSGASRLHAYALSGPRFSLETSGASKVQLEGAVTELVAGMTGASNLRAESLQTKSAEISLTGAGNARVSVGDVLKASITGAGKLEYSGNPAHVERHITGAGTIRKSD
jgi:Putative auto-transporter adhesin, head GIN domain